MRARKIIDILLACLALALASTLSAQVNNILIQAGSPEDLALQQIGNEPDVAKRLAEYKDFTSKFAAKADAVAYANWQIAQIYSAQNNLQQSLAYGEMALAQQPHNMEILTSQAATFLQTRQVAKAFTYCARAGEAYDGIGTETKQAGMTDDQFELQNEDDRRTNQPAYLYAQTVAYDVLHDEADAKKRMAYIQQFNAAFPDSKFQDQVSELTILTLQNLSDTSTAIAYGEAVLEQSPNNVPTLVMMAEAYTALDKSESIEKGIAFARRAIAAAKPDDRQTDATKKMMAGYAYLAMGRAYIKTKRQTQAVPELKSSIALLKSNPTAAAPAMYELGRAYAMLSEYREAKAVLGEAVNIAGPTQQPARELLGKIVDAGK